MSLSEEIDSLIDKINKFIHSDPLERVSHLSSQDALRAMGRAEVDRISSLGPNQLQIDQAGRLPRHNKVINDCKALWSDWQRSRQEFLRRLDEMIDRLTTEFDPVQMKTAIESNFQNQIKMEQHAAGVLSYRQQLESELRQAQDVYTRLLSQNGGRPPARSGALLGMTYLMGLLLVSGSDWMANYQVFLDTFPEFMAAMLTLVIAMSVAAASHMASLVLKVQGGSLSPEEVKQSRRHVQVMWGCVGGACLSLVVVAFMRFAYLGRLKGAIASAVGGDSMLPETTSISGADFTLLSLIGINLLAFVVGTFFSYLYNEKVYGLRRAKAILDNVRKKMTASTRPLRDVESWLIQERRRQLDEVDRLTATIQRGLQECRDKQRHLASLPANIKFRLVNAIDDALQLIRNGVIERIAERNLPINFQSPNGGTMNPQSYALAPITFTDRELP